MGWIRWDRAGGLVGVQGGFRKGASWGWVGPGLEEGCREW